MRWFRAVRTVKRIVLTIAEKLSVIDQLDWRVPVVSIAAEYGIALTTVIDPKG
jgi:hypothetical protein